MRVESLLAKLSPKTILPDGSGFDPAHGGLDGVDVAGSLAMGLSPTVYYFARAKYCMDEGAWAVTQALLARDIERYSAKQGWKLGAGQGFGLAGVALHAQISPPKCPRCNGRGSYTYRSKVRDCSNCKKSGRVKMKNAARARMAGMGDDNYRKYWVERMKTFEQWIAKWDWQLHTHIARQLKEERDGIG